MSLHIFGAVVTGLGTAANNRGLTEGNITSLQKLIWNGQVHTTVSAESIRFALRRLLAESEPVNRTWNEATRVNDWADPRFERWTEKSKQAPFVDDDLLGFMQAEAATTESEASTKVRRGVLEVTRAVSLTPWAGDVTFNAASPGATPSASKGENKGKNPVPYGTEMHATRYQYGFALTPEKLRKPARAVLALKALASLGEVAGNHGRFLFDFSPDSIVLRVTHDAAPRLLYAFQDERGHVNAGELLRKVKGGDIAAKELFVGGAIVGTFDDEARAILKGAHLSDGVVAAVSAVAAALELET